MKTKLASMFLALGMLIQRMGYRLTRRPQPETTPVPRKRGRPKGKK